MRISNLKEYNLAFKTSLEQPEEFWAEIASEFIWKKKWDKVLEWNFETPNIKWFLNGKLNITENCIDRHLKENGNKAALIWEANDINEKSRTFTYKELHTEVCRFANVLKNNGAKKATVFVFICQWYLN